MSEIKDVTGESVNKLHVTLSMWMIENKKDVINISYNGSGDSGDFDFEESLPDNIKEIAGDILCNLVSIDFNNDGCAGHALLFIQDGKLGFKCDHSEYYMHSNDSQYEETLIDTSML